MPSAQSAGRASAALVLVSTLTIALVAALITGHADRPADAATPPIAVTPAVHHNHQSGTSATADSGLPHQAALLHKTKPAPRWIATVVLDPGHNGGNATHPRIVDRLVRAGYGRSKPCNTTGTETNAGYPEHAYTWAVARRVKRMLQRHHVRVIMTRHSDVGVGPCVNVRARIESTRGVAAAIAIHGDGAPAGDHGFHLCVDSRRPVGATRATVARTRRLNAALHRALANHSPISVSNYVGRNGYYYRDDLAGLNLSTNPTAFLEIGNMRNAHDARVQSSPAGRLAIARAVTLGILNYLHSRTG